MKFKTIIADVPAPLRQAQGRLFRVWGKDTGMGRSAESHYKTMTWQALNELGPLVRAVADDDCALFLWVCPPLLEEMRSMREAWGWVYKTKAFNLRQAQVDQTQSKIHVVLFWDGLLDARQP